MRDQTGKELYRHKQQDKQVLDPRVAYMMTNLLQDVMLHGTAAGARAAAGFDVQRRERPALRATAGSRGTLRNCYAWCG